MENRAFDHMLGHLALTDPRVDGLSGPRCMPLDPAKPDGPQACVKFDAVDGGPVDPLHDFDSITKQVYGYAKPMNNKTAPVTMNGFALVATDKQVDFVLSAFNASSLPVLSTLATEFALFDAWHVSVPTCTNPNREFMMSGQSYGYTVNTFPDAGFPQETHFAQLEKHGLTWKIHYMDDPWMAPTFAELRTPERLARVQEMSFFFDDLKSNSLSNYTLLQPRMATSKNGTSNWQHPDNSVAAGEQLISDVYTALRASPYWENTALIITYDEHGGFSDHAVPPHEGVPAPNDVPGDNGFDFTRLGVRVATVVVSPWVPRNTVVHGPVGAQAPTATSQFDATSIIATTNRLFGIQENLTARDAWAGVFVDLFSEAAPRADSPLTLPPVQPLSAAVISREAATPLNDHHYDSLNLLCYLARSAHAVCARHARRSAQAALVKRLPPADDSLPWASAATYPHLLPAAARRLQQQHFGEISAALWATYKSDIGVVAA